MIIIVLQRKNTEYYSSRTMCNAIPRYLNQEKCEMPFHEKSKFKCKWYDDATDFIQKDGNDVLNKCKLETKL